MPDHHGRPVIAALAVSAMTGYGVLFYAFGVVLTPMANDLHSGVPAASGAIAVSSLAAAAAAVPAGKWLDARGGRALMSAGTLVAVAAVVCWSQVTTTAGLYLAFVLIGLASAMTLYAPAFAVLVRHLEPARHANAILAVTVVAGLSTTFFSPLIGWLTSSFGWRTALGILAGLLLAVTLPLHLLVVPRGRGHATRAAAITPSQRAAIVAAARRDPAFWLLAAAFIANGIAITVAPIYLVSYLIARGHPAAAAATIAGIVGVLSVTGRLVTTGMRRRLPTATVTAGVFTIMGAAIALLPAVATSTAGAITCVALFGLGFGVSTLARPALLTERYGTAAFATLAGTLNLPYEIIKAGTPLAAAALASTGHYDLVMISVGICCLISASCLVLLQRRPVVVPAAR